MKENKWLRIWQKKLKPRWLNRAKTVIMFLSFVLTYILICVIVGLFGAKRQLGFILSFVGSILLSPLLIAILLLIFGPKTN